MKHFPDSIFLFFAYRILFCRNFHFDFLYFCITRDVMVEVATIRGYSLVDERFSSSFRPVVLVLACKAERRRKVRDVRTSSAETTSHHVIFCSQTTIIFAGFRDRCYCLCRSFRFVRSLVFFLLSEKRS